MSTPNPENVRKVKSFVTALLNGLNCLPDHDSISLEESAIAMLELAHEFRLAALMQEVNHSAKNEIC